MARYSIAVNRAGVNTANTVLAELRAAATARAIVKEIGLTIQTAPTTAPRFVLARPSNVPAGGTNNVPIPEDAADGAALTSFILTGQTTVPTFATAGPWMRTIGLPVTVGGGFLWADMNLVVPLSGSLLLANLNASGATLGAFDMYWVWDE